MTEYVSPSTAYKEVNVFWNREKKLKIELTTPVNISLSPLQTIRDVPEPADPQDAKTNTDLAFKLLIYGALVLQAALIVTGYSVLVGYYEQFGIDTNELTLGTPTLLLHGYVNVFSGALTAASRIPIIGPALLASVFIGVAAAFIGLITKRLKAGVIVGLSTWIGFSMFLIFFAPAVGVQKGKGMGLEKFSEYTGLPQPNALESTHTVLTDKGNKIKGHLILADSKNTFLLVDRTVFKIDGTTGRVIRETELRAEEDTNSKK